MASPPNVTNSLDDIFGSSPPHDELERPPAQNPSSIAAAEPSELPSLRRQHVTAGYRDGVSASKGEHVQSGFDAGFPVGAQLGMRAGTALGILEGILRGYESRASSAVVKKQPMRSKPTANGETNTAAGETEAETEARRLKREEILKLYQRAVKDLDVQMVFGGPHDFEGKQKEKPEVKLGRTGDAAVSAWEKRAWVAHWEENMDVLEAKDDEHALKEAAPAQQS